MALAASGLAAVQYGRLFEERCRNLLQSKLSMTINYVGGPSDGGIDFQGWWWLPRLPPDTSHERRRIRLLTQCKALEKKLGPVHVRELEGAALLHSSTGSSRLMRPDAPLSPDPQLANNSTSTPESEESSDLTAMLISLSGFSPIAIRRAMASPVPFLLLHLPPISPPTNSPSSLVQPEPEEPYCLASIIWNPKLGATNGLLGGHMEIRQELSKDKVRQPTLYWQGKKLKHWTPELEPDVHVGRYNMPPAPTS